MELQQFFESSKQSTKIAKAQEWKELHPGNKRSAESIVCTVKRFEQSTTTVHGNSKVNSQQEDLYLCTVVGFLHLN